MALTTAHVDCDDAFSCFWKDETSQSGLVTLSTRATANILKIAVAPIRNWLIKTAKGVFDRFYSKLLRLC